MAQAAAFIPMIMQGVGMAAGAQGSALSKHQQADMLDYQAQQNRYGATNAVQQAGQSEETQRRIADQQLGAARAGAAQSGVGLDGSAADVVQQSATNAELDALNIRYGGVLKAKAATDQADLDTWQAKALRQPTFMDNILKFGQPKQQWGAWQPILAPKRPGQGL